MKPIYWIAMGLVVLSLAAYVGWDYLAGGETSPEKLAEQAISASDAKVRLDAASHLMGMKKKQDALPHLMRVVKESNDPDVLVAAIHGLGRFSDRENLPVFFDFLNHESTTVREAAFGYVLNLYGSRLPNKIDYDPEDSAQVRKRAVARLRKVYDAEQALPRAAADSKTDNQ